MSIYYYYNKQIYIIVRPVKCLLMRLKHRSILFIFSTITCLITNLQLKTSSLLQSVIILLVNSEFVRYIHFCMIMHISIASPCEGKGGDLYIIILNSKTHSWRHTVESKLCQSPTRCILKG